MTWPPDYTGIFAERQRRYEQLLQSPDLIVGAKEYYSDKPLEFINDWGVTYDPRNAQNEMPTLLPFITFERQDEFIYFLLSCIREQENGLTEKCRDVGATWCAVGFSVWLWLFVSGAAVGFGSRKEALVDKLGDPDSIFEKIRLFVEYLPRFFWPVDYRPKQHASYMRLINPENGATITGEAGDNIGRGGRKLIYFKDESAHYERPEKIEAALADNTNVQIDISSVNGEGNVFARRRQVGEIWVEDEVNTPGATRVFIFDWRDHPGKNQDWYDKRRKKAEDEGLLHIFAQEVDRDYSAALEGVVIPQIWVKACIDAHLKLGFDDEGMPMAAMDVADEGLDKNSFAARKGVILRHCEAWAKADDVGESTRRSVHLMKRFGCRQLQYDSIGVGSGVKAEGNRLLKEKILPPDFQFIPWNAGADPLYKHQRLIKGDKNSPFNKDFYANLKAQGWWKLRLRCEKTYKAVVKGEEYDPADMISISSAIPDLHQLVRELSQAVYGTDGKGRVLIDKTPKGTRSPNMADGVVMVYWPVRAKVVQI